MGLTMRQRKAVTQQLAGQYQKARKKDRGRMLDQFVRITGYRRSYAAYLLANWGRRTVLVLNGKRVVFIFGTPTKDATRQGRPRTYDEHTGSILKRFWAISDGLCGKRLAAALPDLIDALERCEELVVDHQTRRRLLKISPATIDRLLAPERAKSPFKGRSRTKPGTLLKHQIPIRTFTEWNEQTPGFVEIDLVSHDGGMVRSDAMQSLDVTDVATGWTETRAVQNKAQCWVFEALQHIIARLPFPIKGIDSDNGSEFINNHLRRFCEQHQITFTRSRPYRKNDSCYVEQKNYSIVRRTAGYWLYNTPQELCLLNKLYDHVRLFSNFFQPVMKLRSKSRLGSKVHKVYDKPLAPYRRLLAHPAVSNQSKTLLRRLYQTLNPAALRRKIIRLQDQLTSAAECKHLTMAQNKPHTVGIDSLLRQ